jgi:hypothetical protein
METDLSPTMRSLIISHWREAPSWQKLAYVNQLNATLKSLALSDLRRCYPAESIVQLERRLATRWLGAELADHVYGPILVGGDATN